MFTLSGLILEARENLFRDFWSPFSISFYFFFFRAKKNGTDYGPYSARTPPGRGLYKPGQASPKAQPPRNPSRAQPQPRRRRRQLPPIRRSRASPEVRHTSKSMLFLKKIPFVVFLFRRIFPRLFSNRDFWSDFRFSLTFRSFIGIRRFKRLEFRIETLYPNNQLKQVFATVKFDLDPDY